MATLTGRMVLKCQFFTIGRLFGSLEKRSTLKSRFGAFLPTSERSESLLGKRCLFYPRGSSPFEGTSGTGNIGSCHGLLEMERLARKSVKYQ